MSLEFNEFRKENPDQADLLTTIASASIVKIENEHPEATGEEKKKLATKDIRETIERIEQTANKVYHGVDKYVYDFPPIVDFLVDVLTPFISDVIEGLINLFDFTGWFNSHKREEDKGNG